jgi:hypothetical protein
MRRKIVGTTDGWHARPVGAVILVEGASDEAAVRTLAARRRLDLDGAGVTVAVMGGAHAIGRFLREHGPSGAGRHVAGLCDVGEERQFRRALERDGWGDDLDRAGLEALGFFVCELDLEDELIRALGTERVLGVVESEGELDSFRTFQKQPAQLDRPVDRQLRRFIGTRSGRKIRYGSLLVDALDLSRVPRPLGAVVDHAWARR